VPLPELQQNIKVKRTSRHT